MKCREMTIQNLDAVTAIEQAANQFPWQRKHFESSLRAGHTAHIFLNDSEQIIAYYIVQQIVDEAHLLNICVDPGAQGKGVGRKILEHVIDYAESIPASIILLEVRQSNLRAQNLYSSIGFNEMSIRNDYYPAENGREDAILMAMDLELSSLFPTA